MVAPGAYRLCCACGRPYVAQTAPVGYARHYFAPPDYRIHCPACAARSPWRAYATATREVEIAAERERAEQGWP